MLLLGERVMGEACEQYEAEKKLFMTHPDAREALGPQAWQTSEKRMPNDTAANMSPNWTEEEGLAEFVLECQLRPYVAMNDGGGPGVLVKPELDADAGGPGVLVKPVRSRIELDPPRRRAQGGLPAKVVGQVRDSTDVSRYNKDLLVLALEQEEGARQLPLRRGGAGTSRRSRC